MSETELCEEKSPLFCKKWLAILALAILASVLVVALLVLALLWDRDRGAPWVSITGTESKLQAEIARHSEIVSFWRRLALAYKTNTAAKAQELIPAIGPAFSAALLKSTTEKIDPSSSEYAALDEYLALLNATIQAKFDNERSCRKNYMKKVNKDGDMESIKFESDYDIYVALPLYVFAEYYRSYLDDIQGVGPAIAVAIFQNGCKVAALRDALLFLDYFYHYCRAENSPFLFYACELERYYKAEGNSTNGLMYAREAVMSDALLLMVLGPVCSVFSQAGNWDENFQSGLKNFGGEISKFSRKLIDWTEFRVENSWSNEMPDKIVEIIGNSTAESEITREELLPLAKRIQSKMNRVGNMSYVHEVILMKNSSASDFEIGSNVEECFRIPPTKNVVGVITRHKTEDVARRRDESRRLLKVYARQVEEILEMPIGPTEMYKLLAGNATALVDSDHYANAVVLNPARSTTLGVGARCRVDDVAVAGFAHDENDSPQILAYKQQSLVEGMSLCAVIVFLL